MAAVFLLPLPKIFGVKDTLDMSAFELTKLVIIKVLSRFSLSYSIFVMSLIGGELAYIFSKNCEVVLMITFMITLFVPLLSILGVILFKLNIVAILSVNNQILFDGLILTVFIVIMGYNNIFYSQ